MTRQEVADAVRQAFDDPMIPPASAGRPRTRTEPMVNKLGVFQEAHADAAKDLGHCQAHTASQEPLQAS